MRGIPDLLQLGQLPHYSHRKEAVPRGVYERTADHKAQISKRLRGNQNLRIFASDALHTKWHKLISNRK